MINVFWAWYYFTFVQILPLFRPNIEKMGTKSKLLLLVRTNFPFLDEYCLIICSSIFLQQFDIQEIYFTLPCTLPSWSPHLLKTILVMCQNRLFIGHFCIFGTFSSRSSHFLGPKTGFGGWILVLWLLKQQPSIILTSAKLNDRLLSK